MYTGGLYTLLQACKLVGGNEVVTLELLPQLVPLFLCPPDQRGAYGSSIPPATPSATQPIRSVCLCEVTLILSLQGCLSVSSKRCRPKMCFAMCIRGNRICNVVVPVFLDLCVPCHAMQKQPIQHPEGVC